MFNYIERFLPFSSVDIIIEYGEEGIIITKRAIRPYCGWWHLPGSVILKNERVRDTVLRSAAEELKIEIFAPRFIGIYELFTPRRHYITHLYLTRWKAGEIILDRQSNSFEVVPATKLPQKFIPIQRKMVEDAITMGMIQ